MQTVITSYKHMGVPHADIRERCKYGSGNYAGDGHVTCPDLQCRFWRFTGGLNNGGNTIHKLFEKKFTAFTGSAYCWNLTRPAWSEGTAGLVAIGVSVALTFAVAVAGALVMEPVLPGGAGSPPWSLGLHPSPYLVVSLTAAGLAAGSGVPDGVSADGAILQYTNGIVAFFSSRNCIGCGYCVSGCPFNLPVSIPPLNVQMHTVRGPCEQRVGTGMHQSVPYRLSALWN